jgi:pilus assembly protein Flp/PilA
MRAEGIGIEIAVGQPLNLSLFGKPIIHIDEIFGRKNIGRSDGLIGARAMKLFGQFLRDQSGATAIEYGLIAVGISVVIVTVVNTLGTQVKTMFTTVSTDLATAGK